MKRSNGTGNVSKLPGKRRKPWRARVTNGWNEDTGTQLWTNLGTYRTRPEAEMAIGAYNKTGVIARPAMTLQDVYDEWSKEKYESGSLSKQTVDNYKAAWIHMSKLGHVKFTDLRSVHFSELQKDLSKVKSKSTVQKVRVLGTQLYDYAMDNQIVDRNYVKLSIMPRMDETEKEAFTDLEVKKIGEAVGIIPWADAIMIMLYTGFRINEMLLLTQFSVDWKAMTITGGLKTDAGKNRPIPIHPKIEEIVRTLYNQGGPRLVCMDNMPIPDKYFREKLYEPALAAIGVRNLNPHCCRHTFATRLSKAGIGDKELQELMGHTRAAYTKTKYVHKDIDELKKAINLLT